MAKLNVSYDVTEDRVVKTLTLVGREFSEVWTDNGSCCEYTIVTQLRSCGLDIPEDLLEQIDDVLSGWSSDTDDTMTMLHELQELEAEIVL